MRERVLSCLLVFCLFLNGIVYPANAVKELSENKQIESQSVLNHNISPKDSFSEYNNPEEIYAEIENKKESGVVEIESLREECVKHIQLENGDYQGVSYANPVHRKDENGKWQDIDNRLYYDGKGAYTTRDKMFSFGTSPNNYLFKINSGGFEMSLSLLECNLTQAPEIDNHNERKKTTPEMDTKEKLAAIVDINNTTRILYKEIFDNTDIEYLLSSNNIKENIIIKDGSTKNRFSFFVSADNMTIDYEEDGGLSFKNNDKSIFSMPAPYMIDAEGNVSDNVCYEITETADGFLLNVIPDVIWLEQACYPVIIDPTVTSTSGFDSYVSSAAPSSNFGSNGTMVINGNTSNICYSLIKINMPGLPTYANISDGRIYINYSSSYTTGYMYVIADKINSTWNSNSVTWNTMPTIDNICPSEGGYIYGLSGNLQGSIAVTELAKQWAAGSPNYGVRLKYGSGQMKNVNIKSKECGVSSQIPYLAITYNIITPVVVNYPGFYLQNYQINKYINVDSVTSLKAKAYTDNSTEKWQIMYLHNGYYNIISSSCSKALSVQSGNENTDNSNIVVLNYNASANQQWKIIPTQNGRFKIEPKSGEAYSTQWCLAVKDTGSNDERQVIQGDYLNNDSYYDEWCIVDSFEFANIMLAKNVDGFTDYLNPTNKIFEHGNYGKAYITETQTINSSFDAYAMNNCLHNNNIIFIGSHGSQTFIQLGTYNYGVDELYGDLSNIDLIVLLSCETAKNYDESHILNNTPTNMVEYLRVYGAKNVIGFKENAQIDCLNRFAELLCEAMVVYNLTIDEAINGFASGIPGAIDWDSVHESGDTGCSSAFLKNFIVVSTSDSSYTLK